MPTGAGTVAVDSGFIVLNDRTYPLLRRLFAELGVATRPTEMSMSISLRRLRARLRRRDAGPAGSSPSGAASLDPGFCGCC